MRRLLCNRRKAEWEGGDMSNKTTTTPRRGEWRWRPPLRLRKYLLHRMFGVRFLRMKSSEDIPSHPPTEREREGRKHICHERFREEGRKLWGRKEEEEERDNFFLRFQLSILVRHHRTRIFLLFPLSLLTPLLLLLLPRPRFT